MTVDGLGSGATPLMETRIVAPVSKGSGPGNGDTVVRTLGRAGPVGGLNHVEDPVTSGMTVTPTSVVVGTCGVKSVDFPHGAPEEGRVARRQSWRIFVRDGDQSVAEPVARGTLLECVDTR